TQFRRVTLLTVTAGHLRGLGKVHERLDELDRVAPAPLDWVCARYPQVASPWHGVISSTCLPCQAGYILAGVQAALAVGARHVALGYSGYQSSWPEQTPYAVRRLTDTLREADLELVLPVYSISSQEEMVVE